MSAYTDELGKYQEPTKMQSENEQLKQQLSAAQQEIAALRTGDTCARHCEGTAYRIEARRLKSENEQLKAKVAESQQFLLAAAECIDGWGAYASEYFQEKHDLKGDVKKFQDLASTNSNWLAEHDAEVRRKVLGEELSRDVLWQIDRKAFIKLMVDKFLGWKLPEHFHPDCGISFTKRHSVGTQFESKYEPVGTNLFSAVQAEQMFDYCFPDTVEVNERRMAEQGEPK